MNRCQADITNNKSIQIALKEETAYLEKYYPSLASSNGSKHLVKTMNAILLSHIRNCLPYLRARVDTLTSQYRSLLDSYGDAMDDQVRRIEFSPHFSLFFVDLLTQES